MLSNAISGENVASGELKCPTVQICPIHDGRNVQIAANYSKSRIGTGFAPISLQRTKRLIIRW